MTDVDSFLNITVPDILRKIQSKYLFIITGTRAVNAYLNLSQIKPINTQDWDILFVGDQINTFVSNIKNEVKALGFSVNTGYHAASNISDKNIYSFRSRPWIRLSVSFGKGTDTTFLDIYTIPTLYSNTSTFINKDGLIYSDLGFLVRELNRSEEDAARVITNAAKLSDEQIQEKIKTCTGFLNESGAYLEQLDEESDELIESVGQISDNSVNDIIRQQAQELNHAKNTLIRVAKERDLLFGAMVGGKLPKILVEGVCNVCESLERQYGLYGQLKDRCESIKNLC